MYIALHFSLMQFDAHANASSSAEVPKRTRASAARWVVSGGTQMRHYGGAILGDRTREQIRVKVQEWTLVHGNPRAGQSLANAINWEIFQRIEAHIAAFEARLRECNRCTRRRSKLCLVSKYELKLRGGAPCRLSSHFETIGRQASALRIR